MDIGFLVDFDIDKFYPMLPDGQPYADMDPNAGTGGFDLGPHASLFVHAGAVNELAQLTLKPDQGFAGFATFQPWSID